MKNKSFLMFVCFVEYIAEAMSILLILDTKCRISSGKSLIPIGIMNLCVVFILFTFFWKILVRIIFKEKKLKEGEIDKISCGVIVGTLVWCVLILALWFCINNGLIAELHIGNLTIKEIFS